MPKRVTVRDLAAATGISRTTVALALRNDPRVAEATREEVLQAAEAMGYRRDPRVAELMAHLARGRDRQATETICLVHNWESERAWQGMRQYRQFVNGAQRAAEFFGFEMDSLWLAEPGMTPERAAEILQARGIRGLLVIPTLEIGGHIELPWDQFHSVTVGYRLGSPDLDRVSPHHFQSMRQAIAEARRAGCRRIGFLTTREQLSGVRNFWEGAFLANVDPEEAGLKLPPLITSKGIQPDELAAWKRKHRPDCLISGHGIWPGLHDVLTTEPYCSVIRLGLQPEEKDFAGIAEAHEDAGRVALHLLQGLLIEGHQGGAERRNRAVLINGTFHPGSSLPNHPDYRS